MLLIQKKSHYFEYLKCDQRDLDLVKLVFNLRSSHYELRFPDANDSRLNWKATSYMPSPNEF